MPPEPRKLSLTADEHRVFGDVLHHYLVRRDQNYRLVFTCTRCHQPMAVTEWRTPEFCAGALREHARKHGARFGRARLPKRRKPGAPRPDDAAVPEIQGRFVIENLSD